MKHILNGDQLLLQLEALSNPHRLKIITSLFHQRKYVSELARELNISRPLLYLHLQKLEEANLVFGKHEISDSGKAMKYYQINDFHLELCPEFIAEATKTLSDKKRKE